MNRTCGVLFLLIVFSLPACSTSMPETKIYTLYLAADSGAVNAGDKTSLVIHMDAERYLKQPYIAYRNSPYRLNISKYSKWEASPYRMVGKEFQSALASAGLFKAVKISRIRTEGNYQLKIYLRKFERIGDQAGLFGTLVFDVELSSPAGEGLYRGAVSKKEKLGSSSFTELARGLSSALARGIEEVGAEIKKAVDQQSTD